MGEHNPAFGTITMNWPQFQKVVAFLFLLGAPSLITAYREADFRFVKLS